MTDFDQMNLPPQLARVLEALNYRTPTPIQTQAIPVALAGRDLIGCAQTGTGKTAAFCIPMLMRLAQNPQAAALILAPTRELAVQIDEVLKRLATAFPGMKSALLIGGVSIRPQMQALARRPRILVATPGRLLDHLQQRSISLANLGILVLDEADRMLDMGFEPQLRQILRHLPKSRQTMLFSATLPDNILSLAARFLNEPVRVTAGPVSRPIPKIRQSMIQTTGPRKNDVLLSELKSRRGSVLIFARTKRRTDRIAKYLAGFGHSVTRIHGNRSQGQRDAAIQGFRKGQFRILVATDIAARGLDIPHIAHVINYDLPQVPEDYVHRIGRTARAGASGEALCLVLPEDQMQWRKIARFCVDGEPAGRARL